MWFWQRKTDADYLRAGIKRIHRSDLDGAIKHWTQAIELNPRHVQALALRGDAKRQQADKVGALSDLNRALAYDPASLTARFLRATVHIEYADYPAAIFDLSVLFIENHSLRSRSWENIQPHSANPTAKGYSQKSHSKHPCTQAEESLHWLGNPRDTIAWLTNLLYATPQDAQLLLTRALCLIQIEDFDQALNDLNQALTILPSLDVALLLRARILFICGESAAAVDDMTDLIKRSKRNVQAHLLRGQARADLENINGAKLDFARAIQLANHYAPSYTQMAAIHSLLGNYQDVLTFCDAAIHLDPNQNEAYCYRAVARRIHGDLAGAIADCIYAMQLNPDDHLPYMVRSMTFIEAEKLDHTLRDANTAVTLATHRARPYLTRGLVWQRLGDFEKANSDMSKAIRIESNLIDAYCARAEMREEFGDLIGALHDYQYLLGASADRDESANLEKQIIRLRREISSSLVESLELNPLEIKPTLHKIRFGSKQFA